MTPRQVAVYNALPAWARTLMITGLDIWDLLRLGRTT
jgi:hypothetical protein